MIRTLTLCRRLKQNVHVCNASKGTRRFSTIEHNNEAIDNDSIQQEQYDNTISEQFSNDKPDANISQDDENHGIRYDRSRKTNIIAGYLTGLPKFSNRDDLNDVINSMQLKEAHQYLSPKSLLPTGNWMLIFNSTNDFSKLKNLIRPNKSIQLTQLAPYAINKSLSTLSYNITNKTLLIAEVPSHINLWDIQFIFESYHLAKKPIEIIYRSNGYQTLLVHFQTEHDARHAFYQNNLMYLEGSKVQVHWYDM